jgi:8-oxo-dGTP pyrophosphatase MutT (NUDIX family)
MVQVIEKVTAFVTRPSAEGLDLLLFEHPYAGIQIPAGTVERGESPEAAALREAAEETGLATLTIQRALGHRDERLPEDQGVIYETTKVYARPDTTSFAWARLPRGATVAVARRAAGFSLVTYQEYDQLIAPQYVTYQITGWVPDTVLVQARRRYFFHLTSHEATDESWWVETDQHRWRLFWAPLDALPPIIQPQDTWLEMLC